MRGNIQQSPCLGMRGKIQQSLCWILPLMPALGHERQDPAKARSSKGGHERQDPAKSTQPTRIGLRLLLMRFQISRVVVVGARDACA